MQEKIPFTPALHDQWSLILRFQFWRLQFGIGWGGGRCEQNFWDLGHMSHAMARAGEKKDIRMHWRERELSKAKTPWGRKGISQAEA